MNEKERKVFEMGLRYNISREEEKLRKIAIEQAKILLEIVKNAAKSQDPEVLIRGLNHCRFLQGIMAVSGIEHGEINSSEEKIRLLENEIKWKLFISGGLVVMREVEGGRIEEVREEEEVSFLCCLIFKVLAEGLDY